MPCKKWFVSERSTRPFAGSSIVRWTNLFHVPKSMRRFVICTNLPTELFLADPAASKLKETDAHKVYDDDSRRLSEKRYSGQGSPASWPWPQAAEFFRKGWICASRSVSTWCSLDPIVMLVYLIFTTEELQGDTGRQITIAVVDRYIWCGHWRCNATQQS